MTQKKGNETDANNSNINFSSGSAKELKRIYHLVKDLKEITSLKELRKSVIQLTVDEARTERCDLSRDSIDELLVLYMFLEDIE